MNKMTAMQARISGLLFTAMLVTSATPVLAAENLSEAFTEGKFGFSARWRAEVVNQDAFVNKATAIPLRTRFNFGTDDWKGFTFFIEYDYVWDFGVDTYNEGAGNTPDRGDYPVIADVSGGDWNQGYLQFLSEKGNRTRLGRQRIIYDNARFIGNVGWRQNEQTYDGVAFERKGFGHWDFRAAYIDQANRIFGDDVPPGRYDMNTWLANITWNSGSIGKIIPYYYYIDNDDALNLANQNLGVRWVGKSIGEEMKFAYTLEYAHQEDAGSNPVPYDANYYRVDLSLSWANPTVYVAYESLGGDDSLPGQAFRTPLATLHGFNGWADKFLTTPDAGLVDLMAGVKGKLGMWSWNIVYHDFSAESGSASYGTEWDASISRKFNDRFGLLFKYANFKTDSSSFDDTTKYWAQFTFDL